MSCIPRIAAILGIVLSSAAGVAAAERPSLLLNGFEPEVLRRWAARRKAPNWSYLRVLRIGEDGLPYAGGMWGRLVQGDATEGQYAMVRRIPRPAGRRPDHNLNYLTNERTRESIRRRAGLLFDTHGTFRDFYPSDWSGYAKFRCDVRSDAALRLRVELEDAVIVPALRRVYPIPKGKWVTVEFDMAEAARRRRARLAARGPSAADTAPEGRLIDLTQMANIRITVEHLSGATTVRLDNLRLLAAGAEARDTKLPVITDDSAFRVPAVLPISKPAPRAEPGGRLNTAPLRWEPPATIPLRPSSYGLVLYDVAPLDNDRMLMVIGTARVLKTADGGRTWTGLDGALNKPTKVIDHDTNAPGRVAAAMGPDLMVLGTAKCSGGAIPVDSYSVLVRYAGDNWRPQPRGLLDVDDRHCPEWHVRAVRLPNGRIWACWLHYDRFGRNHLYARYSDDEGRTWRDPAANGRVHLTTRGRRNAYATTWWVGDARTRARAARTAGGKVAPIDPHPPLEVAAWGGHVLCAFVQGDKLVCSFFDGTKWSRPEPAGVPGYPSAAAHLGGRTVYLATTAGRVYRLADGKWVEDMPPGGVGKGRLGYPGGTKTRLSAAGDVIVATWTDGTKIFTAHKRAGRHWSKPREVFEERQGVHWIGAPVRSVANFVPLVWSVARKKGSDSDAPARFVRIPVPAADTSSDGR
jgi:hypothetical protein